MHFYCLQKWLFVPNDKLAFKKNIISLYNLSIIKAAIAYIRLPFTLCVGERERERERGEERKRREKEPLGVWLGSFFKACFLRWGKVFGSTV